MLFHVRMDLNIPGDLPTEVANEIKAREKAYSQELQRSGKLRHIWRLVGEYANYSIFDVESNAELHDIGLCFILVCVKSAKMPSCYVYIM